METEDLLDEDEEAQSETNDVVSLKMLLTSGEITI